MPVGRLPLFWHRLRKAQFTSSIRNYKDARIANVKQALVQQAEGTFFR